MIIAKTLYNHIQISIDTMILVAKLTHEQQEELMNRIVLHQKNQYQDKYFHYSRKISNVTIKVSPRNPLANINYNTMLILQKNASQTKLPYSIQEILQFDAWKIKRIDVAFDFTNFTPFSTFTNRLIMKHHGNVKFLQQSKNDKDWQSEYVGSLNSKTEAKACCYDRNEKEADLSTGIEHDYPLRFEIRLYPKLNEYNFLKRIDHGWIEKKLSKFIFIPDIEQLPLNKWDKRRLYKIQQDYDYLKTMKLVKQKELKKCAKEHRVPFEDIYASNKEKLYSFLELEELVVTSSGVYEQVNFDDQLL
jgi:hypothetical protein